MSNYQASLPKAGVPAQKIAFVVGLICLLGFIIDIFVIGIPANLSSSQWRLNFLQQVSEQSLLLCIGSALVLYSQLDKHVRKLRLFSLLCILTGLLIGLSSLLVIEDNLTLQKAAENNLNIQASELRERILEQKEKNEQSQQVSPETFSTALRSIQEQTETFRKNTKTGAMKTLISSAGNLIVMGVGLVGMGRVGLMRSFARARQRRSRTT